MRDTLPDRSTLPDGADTPDHQPSPTAPAPRAALPHWQARRRLALLLDDTTDPDLAGRLRLHVNSCARCQQELEQLRQAEAWFLAQPPEVSLTAAQQDAAWAAIQARLTTGTAPLAAEAAHLANGKSSGAACDHPAAQEGELVPLPVASTGEAISDADRLYRPSLVPQTPAPPAIVPGPAEKSRRFTPRTALLVTLAASFLVSGLAALVLTHLPGTTTNQSTFLPTPIAGVLAPGDETPAFSFDPTSRHLFALTGNLNYGCPPMAHCLTGWPQCLQLSMLDANSGKTLDALRPDCTQGKSTPNTTTFLSLLDDSARGEMLVIGSDQQVQTVDSTSGAVLGHYQLACCPNNYVRPYTTLLDQQDHLLLTPARSAIEGVPDLLIAQDETSGKIEYQAPLDTFQFNAALVSNITGWLYLWGGECADNTGSGCVEVYEGKSGQKVSEWPESFEATPLAADPTGDTLYVRADYSNGQSETLMVDGRSGAIIGHLPPAQAIAINTPLHHGYLLDDDGVTVIDTRTRRKLSTLPVLAHDEAWVAPAVDEQTGQVFLPIQRGRLLVAQDDPTGQLQIRSTALKVVLDAERAMSVDEERGEVALYPWELPIGPGTLTAYHPLSRGTPSNCAIGWVAARSSATITPQSDGAYTVQFSLEWNDQFADSTASTPSSQSSYPHQHSWFYHIPASGGAQWTSDQGEAFPHC